MALNKTGLTNAIKGLYNALKTYDGTTGKSQADAIDKAAADLADAIDVYVKTALTTVTVPAGTFVIAATGGVPNPVPIPLTGDPNSGTGGLT